MKLLEKSALLQNKWLVKLWHFANVLMCVGKKAAGKKNKFWVGRFSFIQFALEENLIFATALGALHITQKYTQ